MDEHYTVARLRVMLTKILSHDDYDTLMKLSEREILNYLQSTEYREDVDALDVQDLEDLEVIDKILARNMNRTLEKLDRISGAAFGGIINEQLRMNDAWNLTVAAEAIAGSHGVQEALSAYGKTGTLGIDALASATTLAELGVVASKQFPALGAKHETLSAFLAALDSESGAVATQAMRYTIDERNIMRIAQAKQTGSSVLLAPGGTVPLHVLKRAAAADSLASALSLLEGTAYRDVLRKAGDTSLTRLQSELHRAVMRKIRAETRRQPLGTDVLVCYLSEKDLERQNIRMIIKGRKLGIDDDFIREQVMA